MGRRERRTLHPELSRKRNRNQGGIMRARTILITTVGIAVLAAGCSSSSKSSSSGVTAGTTPASGAAATSTPAATCNLSAAPKIVSVVSKPPEDPAAINDFDEGLRLALADQPTVCGQKVDWSRVPDSSQPTVSVNSYLQAVDSKPNVMTGISQTGSLLAVAPQVAKSGIPILYYQVNQAALTGQSLGSPWGFALRPLVTASGAIQADYLVKTLGKSHIGLICDNQPFGAQGCAAAQTEIVKDGGTVADSEKTNKDQTDLTATVIAFKGKSVDGVIYFGYPAPFLVFVNQAADNGLSVPIFGGADSGLIINQANPGARANVWGNDDCVPASAPADKAWVARYEQMFNKKMTGSGFYVAEAYDSMRMAEAAIEKAGSLDEAKIADALRTQTYAGVCTTYKSDSQQLLNHSSSVDSFDSSGVAISKQTINL
jgi:branched-chain amino acid transport system substrate-binding protein